MGLKKLENKEKETITPPLTWDEYFMAFAELAAQRSTCLRRQVGAVLVRNNCIIATGYNGAPTGVKPCIEVGCLREKLGVPSGERHEICRGVHAEQNVLIQAALNKTSPEGAVLYCTHYPCVLCAKMLVNAAISKVIYKDAYPDDLARRIFCEAGIELEQFQSREGKL